VLFKHTLLQANLVLLQNDHVILLSLDFLLFNKFETVFDFVPQDGRLFAINVEFLYILALFRVLYDDG